MIVRTSDNFRTRALAVVRSIPRGYDDLQRDSRGGGEPARSACSVYHHEDKLRPRACHRVLRSDGTPGGYNREVARKRELLWEEGGEVVQ